MKFQDKLNEKIWNGEELRPEVASRLRGVAHAFCDFAEIPLEAVADMRIVGSSANYNYTPHSDLDLHLVIDYKKVSKDSKLLSNYLWATKQLFNSDMQIHIRGIEVEVYAEPVGEEAVSSGVYSLNKGWVKKPEPIPPTENDAAVKAKADELKEACERVEDKDEAEKLLKKIYNMRKSGLADGGEFSTEALAFKRLRSSGCLDRLRDISHKDLEKQLSLEEALQEGKDTMADVNELLFRLEAIRRSAKAIHYRNHTYESHILADRIYDSVSYDISDSLKEQVILGSRELPLQESEYLKGAVPFTISVGEDNKANWTSFWGLIDDTRKMVNRLKTDKREFNAILDEVAGVLATASALIYIQTRVTPVLNESEEDIKVEHDKKSEKEKEIDRKEAKRAEQDFKEETKKGHKYAEEEAAQYGAAHVDDDDMGESYEDGVVELEIEESALDRLAHKLGV